MFTCIRRAVVVLSGKSDDKQRQITWLNLSNINRVSEQVKKGLVLCYVVSPESQNSSNTETKTEQPVTLNDNNLHEFLSQYQIKEIYYHRWQPSATRDELDIQRIDIPKSVPKG
jgi:hypothetical protein